MLDALVRRFVLPANVTAQIVRPSTLNGRRPTVSVIIPCYNYGRYLPQCVDSVLSQEGVSAEVIVIDDASTDGSDAVVRQVAANDPREHAICHTVNKGHIATYNEGLAQVSGEYTGMPGESGRADGDVPRGRPRLRLSRRLHRHPPPGGAHLPPQLDHLAGSAVARLPVPGRQEHHQVSRGSAPDERPAPDRRL